MCYATEGAVQVVNSFITIFTYMSLQSLSIISYAVTRLHNYNTYTPIFHSPIVSITHIHTSNKHSVHTLHNCFLVRTYCLALTLKTDFVSPMDFRITPLNGHHRNGRYCANRVTCVANRCGATKYKRSSLLLARHTSAFFDSFRHGTVETRFLHGVTRHNMLLILPNNLVQYCNGR
jgi:hypothetical protein